METTIKGQPIYSTEPVRPGFEELLVEYVSELPAAAAALRELVAADAEHECEESLHRLAGSLGLYGFGQMEQYCRTYLLRLRSGEPITGMANAILEFSDQLLKVRARPQNNHLA
ncbi:MAG: Hpt domain-containing protein [Planctomycetes bacterium]|nr:Hpt domain-containing protein [Planctomycetota bacterium]